MPYPRGARSGVAPPGHSTRRQSPATASAALMPSLSAHESASHAVAERFLIAEEQLIAPDAGQHLKPVNVERNRIPGPREGFEAEDETGRSDEPLRIRGFAEDVVGQQESEFVPVSAGPLRPNGATSASGFVSNRHVGSDPGRPGEPEDRCGGSSGLG